MLCLVVADTAYEVTVFKGSARARPDYEFCLAPGLFSFMMPPVCDAMCAYCKIVFFIYVYIFFFSRITKKDQQVG